MEKTHWPTARRLQSLREEGLYPFSPFAAKIAVLVALILAAFVTKEFWDGIWITYHTTVVDGLTSVAARQFISKIATMLLILAVASAIAGLLCTLIASKFLFRLSLFSANPERFNPFARQGQGLLAQAAGMAAKFVVAVGVGALFLRLYGQEVLALLNQKVAYFVAWPKEFVGRHAALWVAVLIIFAGASWLLARIIFMSKHKMTSREAQIEGDD